MKIFWFLTYNFLLLPLLFLSLLVSAIFNAKIRKGVIGRRRVFTILSDQLSEKKFPSAKRVWVHVSSVGEFLQVRPVIETLKQKHNDLMFIMTYFSPSVENSVKNFKIAHVKSYLPFDWHWNAKKIFKILNPSLLIFSKYDVWPNLVWNGKKLECPVILINGSLHRKSKRLIPVVRNFFRTVYSDLDFIAGISQDDEKHFEKLGIPANKITVAGNTQCDETCQRAMSIDPFDPLFDMIGKQSPTLVAGSTWQPDEDLLIPAFAQIRKEMNRIRMILVPHEPTTTTIERIKKELEKYKLSYSLFSNLSEGESEFKDYVLIVDVVGILSKIYFVADFAYVGGAFTTGVHNVMEPAALRKPVICGPRIHNSNEAQLMQETGGLFVTNSIDDLTEIMLNFTKDESFLKQAGKAASSVVKENLGATERTVELLEKKLTSVFVT